MASLSDQIDRFARNTRAIKTAASQTASKATTSSVFARAVLSTQLGDLIRDIDPSELGLFTLQDSHSPKITRIQFQRASPLKRRPAVQEIDPEVYARAALKYIEQYEPIRPMPRAYDRILNILSRLNDVRRNIDDLNQTLKHVDPPEDVQLIKTRLESEERNIKDLQERVIELSKKKQTVTKIQKPKLPRPKAHTSEPPKQEPPSSPKDGPFMSNTGRTLRFTDNLLHEDFNLGDVGEISFDSPSRGPGKSTIFTEADSFIEEPTITQQETIVAKEEEEQISSPDKLKEPPPSSKKSVSPSNKDASETSGSRQPRIKVNREVEKIVTKIWATISDTLLYPKDLPSPSVSESLSYIQNLAIQMPQLESPITSTASSASLEPNSPPTVQQVLTAHLLTMLLSSTPHYGLPLNQVKENLALKAKTNGISVAGQGTTRILYGCVAKRLVKIDRSGREQIVKFDV